MKIKELPEAQRPYEKCMQYGPELLSDAELIAILLKSGTSKLTSVDLAIQLLKKYESSHTLSDIFSASVPELTEISGIGYVKAITLKCIGELCKRLCREEATRIIRLTSPSSIASYYMERMRHLEQEEIRAAFFDTKNHLLKDIHISTGTVNSSLITPRELFIKALKYKAVCIVLVHNHPSGDPQPSSDDLVVTRRIKESGDLISIPLIDHIIIGDNKYVSLKEEGIL